MLPVFTLPLASDCQWPPRSSCSSTPRLCQACERKPNVTKDHGWRIAVLHTPKTGGTSIGHALAASGVTACNVQTAGIPLCPCLCQPCFERSVAVIAECSAATIAQRTRSTGRWLWVATIRSPREWFYSAAAQWCTTTTAGRASARCHANTTAADLVAAGWWTNTVTWLLNANRSTRQGALAAKSVDFSLRYFEGNDEQSGYLGSIFSRSHFLVCTTERMASIGAILGSVLLNDSASMHISHTHRTRWAGLPDWAAAVQWEDIRRFYGQDEGIYSRVTRAGGCIARTSSSWLKRVLNVSASPLGWT